MAQNFPNILSTDTLLASRQNILDRDSAAASQFSGTAFPTTNLLVGMRCFRTDLNKIYTLKNLTPTWVEEIDIAGSNGLVPRATALATARTFAMSGDATATGVNFDGTGNVTLAAVLANSGVTAGTYTKLTVDAKGRVTAGTTLGNSDMPGTISGLSSLSSNILRATSGTDVTLSSTGHGFQVGPDAGANVAIDANEIQSRNNGSVSSIFINSLGGDVTIGGSGSNIVLNGTVSGAAISTQAEAEGGSVNTNLMTPLRSKQQIDARIASLAEAQAGTDNVVLMTPLRSMSFLQATLGLRATYVSGNQTITSGGLLTLAHGLGVIPRLVQALLTCVTAEAGYSAGEDLLIGFNQTTSGGNRFNTMRYDATNIYVRFNSDGNVFVVQNKTTGAAVAITNGNWRYIVRAWG